MVHQATVTAPVNIAVVKYWGKRDTKLHLPTNSSLSVTLDQDYLCSTTTARADAAFKKEDGSPEDRDRLWLNGNEETIAGNGRFERCISEMRALRTKYEQTKPDATKLADLPLRIASHNSFPTAAGLASSASGYAALTAALAALYELNTFLPSSPAPAHLPIPALSKLARQGSGSACRSLMGGFVAWDMGAHADGRDSAARQIADEAHWPDMHAIICVASAAKKAVSSTAGMQATVATSPLHAARCGVPAPGAPVAAYASGRGLVDGPGGTMAQMQDAIRRKDFDTFAEVAMAESNQFHAVALDTRPPIRYMNDTSWNIVSAITAYNTLVAQRTRGQRKYAAAYTFDAGPNAVVYALQSDVREIIELLLALFPFAEGAAHDARTGMQAGERPFEDRLGVFGEEGWAGQAGVPEGWSEGVGPFEPGEVKRLIHTKVGPGPRVYEGFGRTDEARAVLGADGYPKKL
ncbi:Diphosphomevalonate decarboxylase [Coniophora puteana RWD-64-598 SS2]|uniref:diphosphomevalonate decarboxylase n=1 Tax=Coniophora puteana (strain RWD-64-598) TaxID=741705 RepID=A0A5M3MWC2_CONPW|nr:Diphosphomevalonate decarboxylase [Coniophora puteana RWD-64-598 SS2]EIW83448.1 Diphosphomevalonate decarboxylase [Coniophora puteana RWD-64-598 SS2]